MTRKKLVAADEQATTARRAKRARMATVLLRKHFAESDVAEASGLSTASIAVLARKERHRALDARPCWQELLNTHMRGRYPVRQIAEPLEPPKKVCLACIRDWIYFRKIAKAGGFAQHRAIACPHTSMDGLFTVAFLRMGKKPGEPSVWLDIGRVEPKSLNEHYFWLELSNAESEWRMRENLNALGNRIGAQVAARFFREDHARKVLALELLAIAGSAPQHTNQLVLAATKIATWRVL